MTNEAHGIDPEELLAHSAWVRGLAKSLLFDQDQVDDVVQKTWLVALRKKQAHPEQLRGWLSGVVKNVARNQRRTESRRAHRERLVAERAHDAATDDLVAKAELHQRVVAAVLELAEPYRSTILMRYFEELSAETIAARLDVPSSTVRNRVKRALAQLRQRLDSEFGDDRNAWSLALIPLAVPVTTAEATSVIAGAGHGLGGFLTMGVKTKIATTAVIGLVVVGGIWLALPSVPDDVADNGDGQVIIGATPGRESVASVPPDHPLPEKLIADPLHEVDSTTDEADATGERLVGEIATFRGWVVDHHGAPVVGALVYHVPNKATLAAQGIDYLNSETLDRDDLAYTLTDEQGRFELHADHVAPDTSDWEVERMFSRLVVLHEDYTLHVHDCRGFTGGTYDAGVLPVEPGSLLLGRLVDEAGRPLPEVFIHAHQPQVDPVHVEYVQYGAGYYTAPFFLAVPTDEHGAFRIEPFWRGSASLSISTPGFMPLKVQGIDVPGDRDVDLGDLVLHRGNAMTGRVLDAEGLPVAGARVHAYHRTARLRWMDRVRQGKDTVLVEIERLRHFLWIETDSDGHFTISGLESANHSLYVDAEGFEPLRFDDVLPGGGPIEVRLTGQAVLLLDVVDKQEGQPIVSASVVAVRRSGAPAIDPHLPVLAGQEARQRSQTSGPPEGFFLVERVGNWRTELLVSAPGYATTGFRLPAAEPPEVLTRQVSLARESVVRGHVRDESGDPVVAASVSARSPKADRVTLPEVEVQTDDEGTYVLTGLKHGDWILTAASEARLAVSRTVPVEAEELHEGIDFVLSPAGAIYGFAWRADGTPHAGRALGARLVQSDPTGYDQRATVTDMEGAYALEGLRPGVWRVSTEMLPLAAGERLRFDLEEQVNAVITGRVLLGVEAARNTVAYALRSEDAYVAVETWAETDGAGRFELSVRPGTYEIVAAGHSPPSGTSRRVRLTVDWGDRREVDLHFGGARLTGTVVSAPTGEPLPGAYIQLGEMLDGVAYPSVNRLGSGTSAFDLTPKVGEDGHFEYPYLNAGSYELVCDAAEHLLQITIVDVEEGETKDVRIELAPSASLRGRVTLPNGVPVADQTRVYLDTTVALVFSKYRSTAGGAFEFKELPPGGYRVLVTEGVFKDGVSTEPILADDYVVLEPAEHLTLDLVVSP